MGEYLQIVTRTFVGRRPDLLLRCHRSLWALKSGEWRHDIIVGMKPVGVARANVRLRDVDATGEWVWVLDDDDVCCRPTLIQDIKMLCDKSDRVLLGERGPDVIVVKCRWVQHDTVLPNDTIWGTIPKEGQIGAPCVITRGVVWNEMRDNWGERYAGDFDYINALFSASLNIVWLDIVAAEIPQINLGRAG